MSKQTSVEWLLQKIILGNDLNHLIIEKARNMHEIEITEAFDTGRRKGDWIFDGEKYYEETYKNEEK
jgi:hypothetical protein